MSEMMRYQTRTGRMVILNTSNEAISRFWRGAYHGAPCMTPREFAIVTGVAVDPDDPDLGEQLWFHLEGDLGTSYWGSCKKTEDFEEEGFKILNPKSLADQICSAIAQLSDLLPQFARDCKDPEQIKEVYTRLENLLEEYKAADKVAHPASDHHPNEAEIGR